jgi:hypothetical protein
MCLIIFLLGESLPMCLIIFLLGEIFAHVFNCIFAWVKYLSLSLAFDYTSCRPLFR